MSPRRVAAPKCGARLFSGWCPLPATSWDVYGNGLTVYSVTCLRTEGHDGDVHKWWAGGSMIAWRELADGAVEVVDARGQHAGGPWASSEVSTVSPAEREGL